MNEEKINQARPKIKAGKWQVEDHTGGERWLLRAGLD